MGRVHGLNSDRASRSSELLSVLYMRSYFTLASVARKYILVQLRKAKFVKTTVESYVFRSGYIVCRRGQ